MNRITTGALIMFGFISNVFGQKSPQGGGIFSEIYELLFCDNPALYFKTNSNIYPWSILKKPTPEGLDRIVSDNQLETRTKLVAYRLLKERFKRSNHKELLGIVIEVPQPGGLDILACYSDKTARYINQGKNLIVWDANNNDLKISQAMDNLFLHAGVIFKEIGPWEKDRLPAPSNPTVRITLLSPDGLYFGQGPSDMFFTDPMAGPTLNSAAELLQLLVSKSESK